MDKKERLKRLSTLFITSFVTSLTANSGYAIVSVLKNKYTQKHQWLSEDEMTDIIALCQSSPGPIAINASVMLGYQIAGGMGAFLSVLGCTLPPLLMMMLVTLFYSYIVTNKFVAIFMKGMQAGVIAMLLDVIISLFKSIHVKRDIFLYILLGVSFLLIFLFDISIVLLLVLVVAAALVKTLVTRKKVEEKK